MWVQYSLFGITLRGSNQSIGDARKRELAGEGWWRGGTQSKGRGWPWAGPRDTLPLRQEGRTGVCLVAGGLRLAVGRCPRGRGCSPLSRSVLVGSLLCLSTAFLQSPFSPGLTDWFCTTPVPTQSHILGRSMSFGGFLQARL